MKHDERAWLLGWEAGIAGKKENSNPYHRRDYCNTWEIGRKSGLKNDDVGVRHLRALVEQWNRIPLLSPWHTQMLDALARPHTASDSGLRQQRQDFDQSRKVED